MARFLFFWTHCTTPISCLLFLFSYRNFTMTIAWTSDKPTSSNHRTSIAPSKWMIIRLITSSIWQLKRSMGKAKRSVFFCIPFWCKYSRFFTTHLLCPGLYPSKHTTSFQRCNNIVDVQTTLYQRRRVFTGKKVEFSWQIWPGIVSQWVDVISIFYHVQFLKVYKDHVYQLSLNCARKAAECKVKRFIEVSTAQVYSSDKVKISTLYMVSKCYCETFFRFQISLSEFFWCSNINLNRLKFHSFIRGSVV